MQLSASTLPRSLVHVQPGPDHIPHLALRAVTTMQARVAVLGSSPLPLTSTDTVEVDQQSVSASTLPRSLVHVQPGPVD